MYLRLAYRNIWRNKRRTLITAASIMFAVFFAVLTRAIQVGAWQKMVDSVVHFYSGYAQIQSAKYWEEQSIDEAMAYTSELADKISGAEGVRLAVPRLESYALAAYQDQSRGVLLLGIDPALENSLTGLSERVVDGNYLEPGTVLIAEGLAEYFNLQIGDTAVFISQGYHGTNAAGKYPVSGIVHFPSPDLNKQLAFLSLPDAQWFFGAEGLVTSIVLDPAEPDEIKRMAGTLRSIVAPDGLVVKDYEDLIPGLLQAKGFDEAGAYIILAVLYAIVGFGMFGTILMMMKERTYELGVLKAIGMKSWELQSMIWIETIILSIIGSIAGIIVSFPIVAYFAVNPITFTGEMAEAYEKFGVEAVMPAALEPSIFINQTIVILLMNTVISIYPLIKLRALRPVEALRVL